MTGMPARQRTPELFKGLHFDHEVVILCVRWYLSYKLSARDLVEMIGERGVKLAHATILRWVQRYVPEFEKRWSRYARTVGGSWRCDETYIKVKGRWTYLYRAVDKQGSNGGLSAHGKTGRGCRETLLSEGDERKRYTSGHHSRPLCGHASGSSGAEGGRKDAEASPRPFE